MLGFRVAWKKLDFQGSGMPSPEYIWMLWYFRVLVIVMIKFPLQGCNACRDRAHRVCWLMDWFIIVNAMYLFYLPAYSWILYSSISCQQAWYYWIGILSTIANSNGNNPTRLQVVSLLSRELGWSYFKAFSERRHTMAALKTFTAAVWARKVLPSCIMVYNMLSLHYCWHVTEPKRSFPDWNICIPIVSCFL